MFLVNTETASGKTGVSPYELVRGHKEGRYPAITIGKGGRGSKLRWDLDLLNEAIRREMTSQTEQQKIICAGR